MRLPEDEDPRADRRREDAEAARNIAHYELVAPGVNGRLRARMRRRAIGAQPRVVCESGEPEVRGSRQTGRPYSEQRDRQDPRPAAGSTLLLRSRGWLAR